MIHPNDSALPGADFAATPRDGLIARKPLTRYSAI
jgi:hypothetical protein